jgi:predicted TIM-barrel fold metal-dependent hydrolase
MARDSRPQPPLLQRRGNDEYTPPADRPSDREARADTVERAEVTAHKRAEPLQRFLANRTGTAATLRAIDAAAGGGFYDVPAEAATSAEAAAETFDAAGPVIDVQTHFVASARAQGSGADGVLEFIRSIAPDRYRQLDRDRDLSFSEYLRCIFLESETALAVLTAAPGDDTRNILSNDEIAGTRELLDRLAGTGRLLHHAIVHPDDPAELDALPALLERWRPAGLKVYTLYGSPGSARPRRGWLLDDPEVGLPFLERASALGARIICAHKGLSGLAATGSPDDIGPAAAAHPELDFLVYHSGYEVPRGDAEEGAYSDAVADVGTNRLVRSLRESDVGPGRNVYAELGSTWYLLLRRPREAAHVLGKLLQAVGEDHVLWGTDSVWYGPAQPLIDAFRAFRIPDELCERHGYPPLTDAVKAKILGRNAARVYGIDLDDLRTHANADELSWMRAAIQEAREKGWLDGS